MIPLEIKHKYFNDVLIRANAAYDLLLKKHNKGYMSWHIHDVFIMGVKWAMSDLNDREITLDNGWSELNKEIIIKNKNICDLELELSDAYDDIEALEAKLESMESRCAKLIKNKKPKKDIRKQVFK